MDIVIRNGTLVTPGGVFPVDVGIAGERVAALGEELHGAVELDATGWGAQALARAVRYAARGVP